jgi:hypothetical protein
MDVRAIVADIKSLSDEDLFILLDGASEEMKRRNGLIGPSISTVRSNSVEENVKLVIDSLAAVRQRGSGQSDP